MYRCLKATLWRRLLALPRNDITVLLRANSLRRLFRRVRQPVATIGTLPMTNTARVGSSVVFRPAIGLASLMAAATL